MVQCEGGGKRSNDAEILPSPFQLAKTELFLHLSSREDGYQPSGLDHLNGSSKDQQPGSESGDTNKVKVVVADDEQIIANTLALILNRSGFEARAVYSGEAAIEVLGSFEPDVLISDVVMTGMNRVQAPIAIRIFVAEL
jgi:PleD family two-component response regulator